MFLGKPMMKLTILIALLWINFLEGQSMSHDLQPMNTVALMSSEVVLSCYQDHVSDPVVVWNFYDVKKTGKVHGTLLSNRGRILPELKQTFLLNRSLPGHYDLVIKGVIAGNAGIYECIKGPKNQPSAHLTVLHDHACGVRNAKSGSVSVHNGDTIQLSCTIHLTGHCQPAVDWTFDNGTFIGRSVSNDTNFESRTSNSTVDFTVNSDEGSLGFIATISFYCPGEDFHFSNLSSAIPEYKHVWKSPNIGIHGRMYNDVSHSSSYVYTSSNSLTNANSSPITAITTASHQVSILSGNVFIIYMNVLLVAIVLMFILGIIIRMVVRKHREKERVNNTKFSPYQGTVHMSQPSEYYEIDIPESIHSEESVTVVNPGGATLPRAEETNADVVNSGISSPGSCQDGERDVICSNTVPFSSNKHGSTSLQSITLPNKPQNKNYIELDASKKEDHSAPSVYKRLANKKQQPVQSSPVTHTPDVEEEQHYCDVNRPRLPTPETNNSVESNLDQLAA